MKYTEEHEWLLVENDGIVTVGITEHAATSLGDIVFVELQKKVRPLPRATSAA